MSFLRSRSMAWARLIIWAQGTAESVAPRKPPESEEEEEKRRVKLSKREDAKSKTL